MRAVRNSPFAGVILAKAAFFKIDEKNGDANSRNIDIRFFALPAPRVKEARNTPFMISAYSSSNA